MPQTIRKNAQVTHAVTCGTPLGFVDMPIKIAAKLPIAANVARIVHGPGRIENARPTSESALSVEPAPKHPRITVRAPR